MYLCGESEIYISEMINEVHFCLVFEGLKKKKKKEEEEKEEGPQEMMSLGVGTPGAEGGHRGARGAL